MARYQGVEVQKSKSYTCSYCGETISSQLGFQSYDRGARGTGNFIYICHSCERPTYFDHEKGQFPKPKIGEVIKKLPENIKSVYEEIRSCYQVGAYTSVVMLGRKLLMHISCEGGAKEGENFTDYVDFLQSEGYINRSMIPWLTKLRLRGNKANHKLAIVEEAEAEELFNFIQIFLKTNYEFALPVE